MSRITKEHILQEIRRTANENGGTPLGKGRFAKATGIKDSDWFGTFWVRWSEATIEAGFSPNQFDTSGYTEDYLILKLIELIRELRKFPVNGDLRIRSSRGDNFPSDTTFKKLGLSKTERVKCVMAWCGKNDGYDDIIAFCSPLTSTTPFEVEIDSKEITEFGFVYIFKSGKFHKIGKSNSVGRREYELGIQLPEKPILVHSIKTDDPGGIEAYWHNRFREKRKGGEWFLLDASDIQAFKRRQFM